MGTSCSCNFSDLKRHIRENKGHKDPDSLESVFCGLGTHNLDLLWRVAVGRSGSRDISYRTKHDGNDVGATQALIMYLKNCSDEEWVSFVFSVTLLAALEFEKSQEEKHVLL
jgi:hypothetical protein